MLKQGQIMRSDPANYQTDFTVWRWMTQTQIAPQFLHQSSDGEGSFWLVRGSLLDPALVPPLNRTRWGHGTLDHLETHLDEILASLVLWQKLQLFSVDGSPALLSNHLDSILNRKYVFNSWKGFQVQTRLDLIVSCFRIRIEQEKLFSEKKDVVIDWISRS